MNDINNDIVKPLLNRTELPSLRPDRVWDGVLDGRIGALSAQHIAAGGDGNEGASLHAAEFIAGLYLCNENLQASHEIVQDFEDSTGSFWHGIMHRMEGDYSNAKYWFHRVGTHPIFKELHAEAVRIFQPLAGELGERYGELSSALGNMLTQERWNPFLFIDAVQACVSTGVEGEPKEALRRLQWAEMRLLLQYCEQLGGGSCIDSNQ